MIYLFPELTSPPFQKAVSVSTSCWAAAAMNTDQAGMCAYSAGGGRAGRLRTIWTESNSFRLLSHCGCQIKLSEVSPDKTASKAWNSSPPLNKISPNSVFFKDRSRWLFQRKVLVHFCPCWESMKSNTVYCRRLSSGSNGNFVQPPHFLHPVSVLKRHCSWRRTKQRASTGKEIADAKKGFLWYLYVSNFFSSSQYSNLGLVITCKETTIVSELPHFSSTTGKNSRIKKS